MKLYKPNNEILSTNILAKPNLIFNFSLILPRFIIKVSNNHKIMKKLNHIINHSDVLGILS